MASQALPFALPGGPDDTPHLTGHPSTDWRIDRTETEVEERIRQVSRFIEKRLGALAGLATAHANELDAVGREYTKLLLDI